MTEKNILDTSPKFINAGEYTVYYQVTSENYNTTTGTAKVIIERKDIATSTIEIENLDKIISGKDKNANVIVKDDNVTLVQSVDYNVTFNDDNNSSIKNDNFSDDENDYEYDDTIAKDPIPFAGITKKIVLGFIVILSIVAVRSIIKYIKIDY